MIGRTNTGGGGGGGLNYVVVGGTTTPNNPKENTIWINTSSTITSHIFSATKPSSAVSGTVWICTENSSAVNFNALKKNNITVYPISAMQYVNYSWKTTEASIYVGGRWQQIGSTDLVIYDNGKQHVELTTTGYTKDGTYTSYTEKGSVTFNSNNIHLNAYETQGSTGGIKYVGTKNTVSLQGLKTLHVEFSSCTFGSEAHVYVAAVSSKKCPGTTAGAYKSLTSGTKSVTLDVSSLGNAYIVITGTAWDSTATQVNAYITKIWAE